MAIKQQPSLIPGQQPQNIPAAPVASAQEQAIVPGVPNVGAPPVNRTVVPNVVAAPRTVIPKVMGGPFHGTQLGPVQFHPSVGLHFKPLALARPMKPEPTVAPTVSPGIDRNY